MRIEDGRWKMAARKSAFASSARFAVLPGDHDDPNDEQEQLKRGEQSRHDVRKLPGVGGSTEAMHDRGTWRTRENTDIGAWMVWSSAVAVV
jgi:hypothetical protein